MDTGETVNSAPPPVFQGLGRELVYVCVVKRSLARLPLYKDHFHFINCLGPQQTSAVRSLFIEVLNYGPLCP